MTNDLALLCPHCGYDLRGATGDMCSECGRAVDQAELAKPQIPWVRRDRYSLPGRFLRTAWWVTNHPRRLSQEVAKPIDYRAAQRFRQVVVLWLTPMTAVLLLQGWSFLNEVMRWQPEYLSPQLLRYVFAAVMAWILLQIITGLHTYALHPTKASIQRQNRAVALGHFACAPLAFAPLLWGAALYLRTMWRWMELLDVDAAATTMFVLMLAATGLALMTPVAFLGNCWLMLQHAAGRGMAASSAITLTTVTGGGLLIVLIPIALWLLGQWAAIVCLTLF